MTRWYPDADGIDDVRVSRGSRGELERTRPGLNDRTLRDITLIRAAADQAARLTRQLLAFSRRQILTPAVLDLNLVVHGHNVHVFDVDPGAVKKATANPGIVAEASPRDVAARGRRLQRAAQ